MALNKAPTKAAILDDPAKVSPINSFAVEWWDTERPIDYPLNARKWKPAAVAKVADSIQRYGWRQPIVVDEAGVIVIGHLRRAAARQGGLPQVPVHVAAGLSHEAVRGLRLADNRTHDEAEWDMELLAREFGELKALDFDLAATAFSLREIDALTLKPNAAEDDVPPVPEVPITKPGDLWAMGGHRLLCGDSTDAASVARLIGGAKVGILLSDPPYGMKLDTDWSDCIGSIGKSSNTAGNKYAPVIGDEKDYDPRTVMAQFSSTREQFWFGADYYAERLPDKNSGSWMVWDKRKESQAEAIGSEFELLWSKQKHKRRILRHDWFGFLSSKNSKEARSRIHPTQKPTSLLRDIIAQWADDGIVCDPYLGSGSTLAASEMSGRVCYGLEITPVYCDVIVKRWENLTGKKAELCRT